MKKSGKPTLKQLLSKGLALLLALLTLAEPAAAVGLQNRVPVPLASSRLDEVPEGNWVYFGTASATLEEANQFYTVPVYREGDVSMEASVEIHTVDMTALYGEDYELVMPDVEETETDSTVLEDYMTEALTAEEILREQDEVSAEEEPSIADEEQPAEEQSAYEQPTEEQPMKEQPTDKMTMV